MKKLVTWLVMPVAALNCVLAHTLLRLGFMTLAKSVARVTVRMCRWALGVIENVHSIP